MNTSELLGRFTAKPGSDPREWMSKPIQFGDWIYATNGHVCVRVPARDGIDALPCDKVSRAAALFVAPPDDALAPLPELPPAEICAACSGSGIGYTCPECDGDGEFEYGSHSYDCKECKGTGQVDDGDAESRCSECNGTGVSLGQLVAVGCAHFARRYLALIAELPGLRFAPTSAQTAAYFSFEGGEGLLMPLRP